MLKNTANTYQIVINGCVQGVGFRPFVYQLATRLGIKGWVNNTTKGVFIHVEQAPNIEEFLQLIEQDKPPLAIIQAVSVTEVPFENYQDFQIIRSDAGDEVNLMITPDCAICEDCKQELFEPNNRRYRYAFITCTNCGPRYSIINELPYDRETTTMEPFQMCKTCQQEYDDPLNRRYYSQTNSCKECAIELSLFDAENQLQITGIESELIHQTVQYLKQGKIVAVKGIGGYMLMGDATNEQVVNEIRQRKHRPDKPIAVMVRDVEVAKKYVEIGNEELELLNSKEAPIVVCKTIGNHLPESLTKKVETLGVLLPYTPLHLLLLEQFDTPLIATSCNSSGEAILSDELADAWKLLQQLADFILSNNREIVITQDDSLMALTPKTKQKIIYRRARGLAPSIHKAQLPATKEPVLAFGADLKNTFSFWTGNNLLVSPYFGDFSSFSVQENFTKTITKSIELYQQRPSQIVCDAHETYFSTQEAEKFAAEQNITLTKVQHHVSHFSAILGEHQLIDCKEKTLGVVWDGLGYGTDKNIWGGEFFTYENKAISRVAHLQYYSYLMGNKMSVEPKLSLLSLLPEERESLAEPHFDPNIWNYVRSLKRKENALQTSSIGRLFDAVACLLLNIGKTSYEGEAAIYLEQLATSHFVANDYEFASDYEGEPLNLQSLMKSIITDVTHGIKANIIAAKFHNTLVSWVEKLAKQQNCSKIACSGGVFQNRLLVDLLSLRILDKEIYFHRELSPNDENISYGQLLFVTEKLKFNNLCV